MLCLTMEICCSAVWFLVQNLICKITDNCWAEVEGGGICMKLWPRAAKTNHRHGLCDVVGVRTVRNHLRDLLIIIVILGRNLSDQFSTNIFVILHGRRKSMMILRMIQVNVVTRWVWCDCHDTRCYTRNRTYIL